MNLTYTGYATCLMALFWTTTADILAQPVLNNPSTTVPFPSENPKAVAMLADTEAEGSTVFYYIPADFYLSEKKEIPEFSFLEYQDEANSRSVLHLLLTWGLSKQETEHLERLLVEQVDSNAFVAGGAFLEHGKPAFEILGENELANILRQSLKGGSMPPTTAGGKMALAFHLDTEGTRLFQEALAQRKKLKQIQFQWRFFYQVLDKYGRRNQELILTKNLYTLLQNI